MPHTLSVTLSDPAFDGLRRVAESTGTDPATLLADVAADRFADLRWPAPGCGDITKFFGTISSPVPSGWSNEQMDAALAREIADNHEPG